MEKGGKATWREEVEDLVAAGDTQGAISFLFENLLSQLQTTSSLSSLSSSSDELRLAPVLSDLASLHSSIGFSLKSDQLVSRASFLKQRTHSSSVGLTNKDLKEDSLTLPDVSLAGNDNTLTHIATQSKYGTHHVLVFADFSSRTRMSDLEKIFEDFRDCGVVIHWVNDTTALAVFRTPSIGNVEPPRQRPQTSARTAQRLIAQAMGSKFAILNRGV